MEIREDDLTGARIQALLHEHLHGMRAVSPPESVHALEVPRLCGDDITFWSAWEGSTLLGCGALQQIERDEGELKSMHTVRAHRGRGVGTALLRHIIAEARARRYTKLHAETGSMVEFAPARALYARHGFRRLGPFGKYVEDPNSVFMTLDL